jgi:hypothetical protein
MTQKPGRRSLFIAMLLTVPCPSFFLFCMGLMPVSAQGLGLAKFASEAVRDPPALVFAIAALFYVVVYGACLNWLAGFLSRRLSDRILIGWRASRLLMAALLVLAVLPVYSFDCMDGASSRWCNWYELHVGWFGGAEACGDFHW